MADEKGSRLVPPYLPWKTFAGYLDFLAEAKVLPHRIDTGVMPSSMSGATKGALKTSLRFLGLIDDNGTVQDTLATLIETHGTDGWKPALGKLLSKAYASLIGDLDLSKSTATQLNEKFAAAGIDGEMKFKAVRFYLAALTSAGVEYSPFFTQRGARTLGRKRGARRTGRETAGASLEDDEEESDAPPTAGMTRWPIPIPGKSNAVVIVPDDIALDDWVLVDSLVRLYINRLAKLAKE